MPEPRFLILRLGSLGDIVHTFPAVAGLRATFPNAEIVWLTHPRWESLVSASGLASEIWTVESRDLSDVRKLVARIRAGNWDASIDYQGLWKSALLPYLGRVCRRIGFSSDTIREYGVPILYTERVACRTIHIADQNGELSVRAGASAPVAPVRLTVLEADRDKVCRELSREGLRDYVVLSPGGGWRAKCWPADRFGELCNRLALDLNIRCVINYGPGEEDLAAAVQRFSGHASPVAYNYELGALMALLQGARCVVGGDTGPLHLAIALGAQAVAIYGPTDPARNGPYPPQPVILRDPEAVTSHKRDQVSDASLYKISVEEVLLGVKRQLGVAR